MAKRNSSKKRQPHQGDPIAELSNKLGKFVWGFFIAWPLLTIIGFYLVYVPIERNRTSIEALRKDTGDKLESVDARLGGVDRSLAKLESLPDDVRTLDKRLDSVDTSLAKFGDLPNELTKLQKRVEQITEEIQAANAKVVSATKELDAATERIAWTSKQLDDLKTLPDRVAGIEKSLAAVSKAVIDQGEKLKSIEDRVAKRPVAQIPKTVFLRLSLPTKATSVSPVDGKQVEEFKFVLRDGVAETLRKWPSASVQSVALVWGPERLGDEGRVKFDVPDLTVDASIDSSDAAHAVLIITVLAANGALFKELLPSGRLIAHIQLAVGY